MCDTLFRIWHSDRQRKHSTHQLCVVAVTMTKNLSLHEAVQIGELNEIARVLAAGGNEGRTRFTPNDPDSLGYSPVHYVAVSRERILHCACTDILDRVLFLLGTC